MKHFFTILILLNLFLGCQKKIEIEPTLHPNFWGEATAEKNGVLWSAHPACWIDIIDKKTISMKLDSFYKGSNLYHLAEDISLVKIPPIVGTYPVSKLEISNLSILHSSLGFWDGDQPLGDYSLLESDSSTNLLTLAAYDTLSKEIKGSFNLTFIVQKRPFPYTPDTIRFRNGQFHGKLVEK